MELKIPPHNQEAEESVLGALMLSKEAITTAIEILREEDFTLQHMVKYILQFLLYIIEMSQQIL